MEEALPAVAGAGGVYALVDERKTPPSMVNCKESRPCQAQLRAGWSKQTHAGNTRASWGRKYMNDAYILM